MIPIQLETVDGKFVARVEIPPFKMMPEVIMWGTRIFTAHGVEEIEGGLIETYREAFCYAVPR